MVDQPDNGEKGIAEIMGKEHFASHANAVEACHLANEKAAATAKQKGTCITTVANPKSCTFENGMYTARAVSANEAGSCNSTHPVEWSRTASWEW